MRRRRAIAAVVGSLAGVALAAGLTTGCGSSTDEAETPASAPTTTAVTTTTVTGTGTPDTTTTTADPGAAPVGGWGTDTVTSAGFLTSNGPVALLTDVRQAAQPGFQRLVFQFAGDTPPQFRVGYVDPPARQPASGNPVPTAGAAVLEIQAEPASMADFSGDTFTMTYDGPRQLQLDGPGAGVELVLLGDFEANLHWAVGLDRKVPFAVATLTNPSRLVIDLRSD
jgi:hypothetical protein